MLRVCFNCYGNYTTDNVFQWDQNHILSITGLDIDQAPAVHFCNKKSEIALVVQSEKVDDVIKVSVPNQLLEEPYNIIAYVHLCNDNQAKTIETITIPLIKRTKPDDYQFTENVEVMTFERLEADFLNLADHVDETLATLKREYVTVDGKYPEEDPDNARAYIEPRRGTASAWTSVNPILSEGEIAIEVPDGGVGTGTVKIKQGDGVTAWNNLPYALDLGDADISSIGDGTITGALSSLKSLLGLGGFRTLNGVSDCNDIGIGYSAYVYKNTTNAPDTSTIWQIFCYGVNSNNKVQIAFNINDFAIRKQEGGTWSTWKMYLSTSGGTMTNVLNSQHVYPTEDNVYNLGAYNKGFLNVNARNIYSRLNQYTYCSMSVGAEGTETAGGYGFINVGNPTPTGTKGNAWGYINLFGQKKGATSIRPTNNTDDNVTISLPKTSGTLLRKEDFTFSNGVLTLTL